VATFRAGHTHRLARLTVDLVLLVGLVFTFAGPTQAGSAFSHVGVASGPLESNDSGAVLRIDPPTFWMLTDGNVTLQSLWATTSPMCDLEPLWYAWSVVAGNASGFVNSTDGASTTFTAESFHSGSVSVVLHSDAEVECGATQTVANRTAVANISVAVPFSISDVTLNSDLLSPAENATLAGRVMGGEAPYSLQVV